MTTPAPGKPHDIGLALYEALASFAIVGLIFICSIYSLIMCALDRHDENDKLLTWWGQTSLKIAKVNLKILGLEKLPQKGVIVVFNHLSLFDILFIYAGLPKRIRFGAKIELFRIPIFGQTMRLLGTLPIARQDRAAVRHVYSDAARRTGHGESFALAPEGTRQSEPGVGDFKLGPFVLAIEARAPIVPIVIKGAEKVLTKASWLISLRGDRRVTLQILAPIETAKLTYEDRHHLRDQVRAAMVESYAKLPN